ncbi:hypothetical protein Tco_0765643 [Tanacetum coccineum]
MLEPFKMLKTKQRARSSAGRDPGHLLSSEIRRWRALRLENNGHGSKGQAAGHNPGVGRVLARQGRDVIFINEPQCTHTDADVDELLTQLESHHEVSGGSGSGGVGDDEPGADEDVDGDEDVNGDEES